MDRCYNALVQDACIHVHVSLLFVSPAYTGWNIGTTSLHYKNIIADSSDCCYLFQMQDLGQPPKEIVGDMAPGLDFDADGVPKFPGSLDACLIMWQQRHRVSNYTIGSNQSCDTVQRLWLDSPGPVINFLKASWLVNTYHQLLRCRTR